MTTMAPTDAGLDQEVATYVGGVPVTDYLKGCVAVASQAVAYHIRACQVPEETRRRAVMEVAAELYHRKSAPNGIKSYGDLDGVAAVRVARDAMVAARPLLAPYLPLAIA